MVSFHCTDGKTEVQNHTQQKRATLKGLAHCLAASSPEILHWVLWTARERERSPQRAWEVCWDLRGSLVKLRAWP